MAPLVLFFHSLLSFWICGLFKSQGSNSIAKKGLQSVTTNGQNTDVCHRNASIKITFDSPNLWHSMIDVYIKGKLAHRKSKVFLQIFQLPLHFWHLESIFMQCHPPLEKLHPINCPFENYSNLIICSSKSPSP